jgi:GDP-mannose 6-dehydrogenase
VKSGRLTATSDVREAVIGSDISLVCVGTPSRPNGSIDLAYVVRVSEQIGAALKEKGKWHTVVIRSTVMPGTIDTHVIPAIEAASGLVHGKGFAVCSNPEFLREGTSIKDFRDPPFTLVGAVDPKHAEPVVDLYKNVQANVHVVVLRVAETIKYACNCFHGLKVGFANEIGNLCKVMGVDSHEVMRLFCEDKKLNISTVYLRPGFARWCTVAALKTCRCRFSRLCLTATGGRSNAPFTWSWRPVRSASAYWVWRSRLAPTTCENRPLWRWSSCCSAKAAKL